MDYTNNPSTNQHPNQHDYDQLNNIYSHIDSLTTLTQTTSNGASLKDDYENPSDWGKLIKSGDKTAIFERNIGVGRKVFTFVVYAD